MRYVLEILISLLCAMGLAGVGWLLFGRLLSPVGRGRRAFAVLPARGDGAGLEYTLAGFNWLRGAGLARFSVVVADAGLDQQGRAVAAALAGEHPEILFCPMEELGARLAEWSAGQEWRERGGDANRGAVKSDRRHGGGRHLSK